jgi:UDP-N-acetylmuramoyl-L-alanyl-D-glutamate--2,6-diaminopimelate ligase
MVLSSHSTAFADPSLEDLLPVSAFNVAAHTALKITHITADSRLVKAGALFVALSGTHQNGAAYITAALKAGAVAVVSEAAKPADFPQNIPYIQVENARQMLSQLAARFYPQQPETTVAITGTSGKSSVADFVRQIFSNLKYAAASVGTIGIVTDQGTQKAALTTPDPVPLHHSLQTLAQDGITHLAMEASSHGLDQYRLDGVRLKAAAFLNLGHDHLDYHPTMEDYFHAKMRLFDLLPAGNPAVVQVDTDWGKRAAEIAKKRGHRVISVGEKGETLHLTKTIRTATGQDLQVSVAGQEYTVHLPLIGDFQASNALVAAALVGAITGDYTAALAVLPQLQGVKGRLEAVAVHHGAPVLVDYAHKPDALAAVLDTLRPYATGRLVCVVGCGGDRDTTKRPIMGGIAAEKADVVIITDDNPRSEEPEVIRAAILAGIPALARAHVQEIGDRRAAIAAAMDQLRVGDVLVIAGKGHESGQIIKGVTLPFSDQEEIVYVVNTEKTKA